MRADGYKCYNSECKYYWGEICRASANVTLTCIGRIVHKQTNADHIRSMTDEELAEWMSECNAYGERAIASQWMPWLKQPYKEDL